jgi:predicted transposase/invertase (TIGR01784 family)
MARKKRKQPSISADLPLDFGPHKHDRYFRFALQVHEMGVQFIRHALPAAIVQMLDLNTLETTDTSFLDEEMAPYFSDICYRVTTKDGRKMNITILVEHKSYKPARGAIYTQLLRYGSGIWERNLKQNKPLAPVIPIVLYHGETPWFTENIQTLFADADPLLYPFLPDFKYILVDIAGMSDEQIRQIDSLLLLKFFMALKASKDVVYMEQHWKEILIFAKDFKGDSTLLRMNHVTVAYLSRVSPDFNEKINNMDNLLTSEETSVVQLNHLVRGWEEAQRTGFEMGMEKGIEKTVARYMKQMPDADDATVAQLFELPIQIIAEIRAGLGK